ncbi:hypothetical protein RMATCC62417_11641 [Rhizopus microsporus]|nr:hypothetical protein RMATCC62417_11641 [Rhizopus microsporus]
MNNTTTITGIPANCSACGMSLESNSAYRACQTCRERVVASRRRRRAEDQQEEAGVATRSRGRPRTVETSDAESRPKGRPRAEPAAYISQLSHLRPLGLERMSKECPRYHTLHWINERQETSSMRNPSWESCCKRGSVQLQLLPDSPEYMKDLLERTNNQGRVFKDSLRQYNAAFAFTSLGCDIVSAGEHNANNNRGELNAFQIHGALCHRQGPLLPVEGNASSYAQLYIYDPLYAAQRRPERNEYLGHEIIGNLSTMFAQCNHFARIYRHAYEILSSH